MTQLSVALLQWMHSGVGLLTLRFFLYCTLCFATISCLCDASRWQCVTFIFKSPHYNATHPTPSTHTANLMPLKGIFPTACCFCRGPSRLSLVTLVAPLLAKEGTGAWKQYKLFMRAVLCMSHTFRFETKVRKLDNKLLFVSVFQEEGNYRNCRMSFLFFKNISLRPLYHFLCGYFESLESLCSCFSSFCGSFLSLWDWLSILIVVLCLVIELCYFMYILKTRSPLMWRAPGSECAERNEIWCKPIYVVLQSLSFHLIKSHSQ